MPYLAGVRSKRGVYGHKFYQTVVRARRGVESHWYRPIFGTISGLLDHLGLVMNVPVVWQVYIWHIAGEEPIAVVSGHTRCVNCVAWNPVHHDVLVSASDDYSLRLWGPRTHHS
ncbi:hypothetical protein HF086_007195 [Spodoptera exigua]|uniref:Peroxin-7 n=1 Tax=Spodoptera exigua TaxID=7107 RepID=A0A922MTL7_SPOEX|nr:hypothetical protein HF086_007195 [Spodoptera exigua]